MEAIKEVNEKNIAKGSRIKGNIRAISPKYKHNRRISRFYSESSQTAPALNSKSPKDRSHLDSPTLNLKSAKGRSNLDSDGRATNPLEIPPDIQNLKRQIIRRASTMPNLFDNYDLKSVYEETRLRKKVRESIQGRNHTSPFMHQRIDSSMRWKGVYRRLNISEYSVDDAIEGLTEKEEKQFLDYLARRQSHSGLWKMASAAFHEYKANKSHSMEDLAMAIISKQIAIKKMREKISRKLELPGDKFRRIAALRENVHFIEQKFENMKHAKPKKTHSVNNLDMYNECDAIVLPPRFTKPGEAKAFFRKYGRIVFIVLNWIFLIMDGNETTKLERELKSFVDIAQEVVDGVTSSETMEKEGLSFDRQAYKANREIMLTQEHRKILTTRWNFRTPDMVKQVMHGLQTLRSLSDYPLRTQERLCQVAWYQTIGPKKVILRQGHKPESFYFILSGTAFVKKIVQNEKTGESKIQVVARLTRGQSFGEVGLIFNTKRTATVESTTPMDLLVIGQDDFNSIFMKAEDLDEEAEHVTFLRQVPIMSQWPIDCLKYEPGTCVLHYFKRGQLITANGKTSEWLYVVKSGTCEVMKELKATKLRKPGQSYIRSDPVTDIFLPELGMGASPRIESGVSHKRKFVMTPEIFEEMSKYYDKLKQKLKALKAEKNQEENDTTANVNNAKKNTSSLPKLAVNGQLISKKDDSEDKTTPFISSMKSPDILVVPPVNTMRLDTSKGVSCSTFSTKMMPMTRMKAHIMFPTASMIEKEAPEKKQIQANEDSSARKSSVFVHVQLLQAKDVFGMNTLSFIDEVDDMVNESPQLCLVSRGAEIVMLSKRTFKKYADDKVRSFLRDKVRPYPTESKLQDKFQTKLDWDFYKDNLIQNVLKHQCTVKAATGLV